ncbi:MAG: hypothetical protein ACYCPN_06590 [Thermoplasmata archaeon]
MTSENPAARRILGRHRSLLSDPRVRSWWRERSLRSRLSADTYLRHIGLFCERLGLRPRGLVELARNRPELLRRRLVEYALAQQRAGRLDSYIAKSFEGLRSFLTHQEASFARFPALAPIRGASLARERVPTPEELDRVLENLSARGRVIALFLADSGVRPGVLGSYGGEDGLTLADLPELELGPASVSIGSTPFAIRVPARLSKTRREYLTFGTGRLARALEQYLAERRRRGEPLGSQSPVVAPGLLRGCAARSRRAAAFGRGFLTPKSVTREIHHGLAAVCPDGVTWRPYVLRAYCATRLLLAEGRGWISRDLREAILGHSGGVAARYHVGKRWGPELLEEARLQYRRAARLLEPGGPDAGADPERAPEPPAPSTGLHVRPFRLKEAERRLAEGWRYIGPFGPSRVLLEPADPVPFATPPQGDPRPEGFPEPVGSPPPDSEARPSTDPSGGSDRGFPRAGSRAGQSRSDRGGRGTKE